MPADLKIIKLISGDEIIGYVEDGSTKDIRDDSEYTISNIIFIKGPMRIIQEYDTKTRGHSLFLVDWMPSGKSNMLPIPKDKIITMDSPQEAVEDHYLEIMTSKMGSEDFDEEEEKKKANLELLKHTKFEDDDMQ